jgi:hypothetical protein
MRASTCRNCRYWQQRDEIGDGRCKGECRFTPPPMFMFPMAVPAPANIMLADGQANQPSITMIGQAAFPETTSDAWCGAHPSLDIEYPDAEDTTG